MLYERKTRTKIEALAELTRRYTEQCERFPRTREIPLSLYLRRNVHAAQIYYVKAAR